MTSEERKKPYRRGLRKKIVSTILVVGIFPLVVGVYLTYLDGKEALTRSIGANFEAIARETGNKIYIVLENELSEAKAISLMHDLKSVVERSNLTYRDKSDAEIKDRINKLRGRWSPRTSLNGTEDTPLIRDVLENKVSIYLRSLPHYEKEYIAILVTDERGVLVAATDSSYDYYQGDKDWWKGVRKDNINGSAYISDIVYNEGKDVYLIEIAVPIYREGEGDKRIIGAIDVLYKAGPIFNVVGDLRIGNTGHANLISNKGEIVICPIFPPRSHTINQNLVSEIISKGTGWTIAGDDGHGGINSIVGFAPVRLMNLMTSNTLSGNKWYILIRQHPSETYAPIQNLLLKVYLMGLVLIGILILTGFYAAEKIVQPILLLKEESELIGKGNLDHRVNIRTGDEIESLAEEFNMMAEGLKVFHGQLRTEKDKLENIILSAGEGIVVADAENKVVMINPIAEKILGVTMDSIKGKPIFPCHKEPDKVQKLLQLKGTLPMSITVSIGLKIVEINVTTIKSDKKMIGSMMVMRDVTRVKHMEEELKRHSERLEKIVSERTKEIKETKEYLESLLENANDVIYTLNEKGIFTYVNQKIAIWGYEKEELIGKPFYSLVAPEDPMNGMEWLDRMDPTCETRIRDKDGELRDVLIRTSLLKGDKGSLTGYLGIATDITDQKKIEEQMMRTEKLAAVGQLSMGVAHEINNPLSGMLNCVRTLSEEGENETLRERYLDLLEKGLKRIESVVKQLLGFSKEQKFEFAPYNIDDLVMDTLRLIEHKIEKENIKLHLSLDCKTRKYLLPVNHLQQVVLNIVINAIQAMPQGGNLTLKSYENKKHSFVEISDTGDGIPRENLKRIFDPFFTTKDVGMGTGLGLYLSYGIIKRIGGDIEVESEAGRGSTFRLIIPHKREVSEGMSV